MNKTLAMIPLTIFTIAYMLVHLSLIISINMCSIIRCQELQVLCVWSNKCEVSQSPHWLGLSENGVISNRKTVLYHQCWEIL
jgi:hypothetical protein